jgi:hypothetical protein
MKTVIALDDEALSLAAKELGTTTKKDTVNAALDFVANRRRRIEQLLDDPYALLVRTSSIRRSCGRLVGDHSGRARSALPDRYLGARPNQPSTGAQRHRRAYRGPGRQPPA